MNKAKLSWGKHSLVFVLSLGFMILGIGSISWAIINILAQPDYAAPSGYIAVDVNAESASSPAPDKTLIPVYLVQGANDESAASPTLPAADEALYPVLPAQGDNIGSLTIPALKRKLPIIQGTGVDELKKGVGHFTQSVLPGEQDNCVLSGHRDTVFRKLGKLKIGDQLIVQTSAGTYTYEIKRIRIVHKDDKTVIVPTDHAVLTLTTCYPFIYIGDAPDRYILIADLVS